MPTSSDTAVITLNADVTVTVDADASAGGLDMSGTSHHILRIESRTFTLSGPVTMTSPNSALSLEGGTLVGTGTASVDGTILWSSGAIGNTTSKLTLKAKGILAADFGNSNMRYLYGVLTNLGTIHMLSGTMLLSNAQMYNQPGGLVELENQGSMTYSVNPWILNQGTWRKAGADDTCRIDVNFTNYGTVDVQGGALEFSQSGSFNAGSVFTGTGTNVFTDGTFALNTSVTIPNAVLDGATWIGNGSFGGNWIWLSGQLGKNGSTLTFAAGSMMTVDFGFQNQRYLQGVLTNAGTIRMLSGYLLLSNAQLYNQPGAVVEMQNQSVMTYSSNPWIVNQGTFRKSGGIDTCRIDVAFTNYGTVDVEIGALEFSQNGSFNAGSIFSGAGTNLFTDGTFALNTSVTLANAVLDGATWAGNKGTLGGNWVWVSGQMGKADSSLTLAQGSIMEVDFGSQNQRYMYGAFTNAGTIRMLSGAMLLSGAQFYNLPTGVVDVQNQSRLTYSSNPWIYNQGTFRKSGMEDTCLIDVAFTNFGMVNVQIGTLEFSQGGSFNPGSVFSGSGTNLFTDGTFALNTSVTMANAVLNGATWAGNKGTLGGNWVWVSGQMGKADSSLTLAPGSIMEVDFGSQNQRYMYGAFTNAGLIRMLSGSLLLSGAQFYNLPGALVDLQNQTCLTYSSSPWIYNQGTFQKSGLVDTCLIDVAFTNYGTVDVQVGTLEFSQGGSFNPGSIFVGPGTNLFTDGTFVLNTSVTVNNAVLAGATWLGNNGIFGGNWIWMNGQLGKAGSILTLAANGLLQADFGPLNQRYMYGVLTNAGTVQMISGTLLMSGTQLYNLQGGMVDFVNDANMTYSSSPWIYNQGTLRKSGGTATSEIEVTVTNLGTIDAQVGTLSFTRTHTLLGGTLSFGLNSLTDFGKINLANGAALTGTVGARLNNGYQPSTGSSFPVLTYGSRTGIFNNTALPSAASWHTNYAPTVFTLIVSNARPVLVSIPNQFATQEVAFSVTATASHVDSAQTLTYGLASAPKDMTINPTTGVINWTPHTSQSNTTNTVVVTVTDNGIPPLSDTNSFTVTVLTTNDVPTTIVRILSFGVVGDLATLSWTSIPGRTYHLQYEDSLSAAQWTDLLLDFVATDTITTAHPTISSDTRTRFYRVVLLP